MSIVNARKGAYMRATSGGTNRRKSSNYSSKKNNSAKKQKTEYGNRSNAASGNANKNSNKKKKQKTGLEALIDRKDELKNIPAGDGSGRNQYQVEMNKFKSTPGGKKIFKKRFPNPLVKIAKGVGDYVKQGGVIGLLANMLGGGKKAATGFGKDASTMASDIGGALAKAFGLDALQNKNIDIASGKTDDDFNKLVTSTRMRNNLAYGDPLGLNKAPIYRDPIMNMGLPNIDVSMEDAYSNFQPQVVDDKDRRLMDERDQQQLTNDKYRPDNEDTLGIDLTDQYSDTINLSGDPNEVIEDVSETEYDTSGLRKQIDMNTEQDDIFTNNAFMGAGPNFPAGGVGDGNSPSGLNFYGGDTAFADTPEGRAALEALRSNQNQSFINMSGIVGNKATGGYMSSFPNQNLNTESLSASDNIDDRIMKNLEFEKMAPGMMGYNEGGRVMSTYDKLKAIADNNYGQ
jgi:hypothetical protein